MFLLSIFIIIIFITSGIYFFQEKLIFFPEVLSPNYQYRFDHYFEEVNYSVEDNVTINALHFKAEKSRGIVFYSHGNAGSLAKWGDVADIFLANNYDILIYDYRGYGKSSGSVSEANLYNDAMYIYEQLAKEYGEHHIVVYGRSIGTGIATKVASKFNPKQLILESPYYNLPDLAKKILPFVSSFLLKYKFANDELIGKIDCPITIFHGTDDEVIYFGSSLKLEKLMKKGDKMIAIVGGHHNDLENFEAYRYELKNVLK